jgi:predicted nucleic acid-binding protein
MHKTALDTNVLVAALMSRNGASFRLIELIGTDQFEMAVSVPLILEYEAAAKRWIGSRIVLTEQEIDDVIDYICAAAEHHQIDFLWRPLLKDTGDETDFEGITPFGIEAIRPKTFLERIGALP